MRTCVPGKGFDKPDYIQYIYIYILKSNLERPARKYFAKLIVLGREPQAWKMPLHSSFLESKKTFFFTVFFLLFSFSSIPLSSQLSHKTHNQLRVAIECHKGVKVKVVKWWWKKWNGPILMHIYAKQCEIMQKNRWKKSNGQIQNFARGSQLRGAKNMENWGN